MSTDKTLADVQPGGRVRLGDQAERARFEAWYVGNAFDYEKNPIGSRECSLMWKAWQAGLTTRQTAAREPVGYLYDWTHSSALGRGEEIFTSFTPDIEAARGSKGAVNIRPVYAAQPSPGGQEWPFVESPADFSERMVQALRKFDMLGAVRHVLIENPPTLAARQPVGQIVGYMDPDAEFLLPRPDGCVLMGKIEVCLWRTPSGKYTKPLYDAPAQAVDLGAVREALQAAEGLATVCASVDGYSREEVAASGRAMKQQFADALAKVDSQAVGK